MSDRVASTTIGIAGPLSLLDFVPHLGGDRVPTTDGLRSSIVSAIALELRARGRSLELFTLSQDERDVGTYEGTNLRMRVGLYRSSGRRRALDGFRHEIGFLSSAIGESQCAFVHAHWTYEFALAALASGRTSLITVHDWAPRVLRLQPDVYRARRFAMNRQALRAAPNLTANSPYISANVERRYGKPCPVIPNGLALAHEPNLRSGPATGRTIGALNTGFVPRKNVETLLRAFRSVRQAIPQAELHLAGQGYEADGEASRWARSNRLESGVVFNGELRYEEVAQYLGGLDLFVHPSLEESFGLVLIEAMANGVPVIGGATSGAVPWVLDQGRAGMLVDVRSETALASEMIKALTDDDLRWSLAKTGLRNVRSRFSLGAAVDQYEAMYHDLLGNSTH